MGKPQEGLTWVFQQKVEQLELMVKEKTHNLRRLEAQRNELNTQGRQVAAMPARLQRLTVALFPAPAVRQLREELQLRQEPGSYVGEVIKVRRGARAFAAPLCSRATALLASGNSARRLGGAAEQPTAPGHGAGDGQGQGAGQGAPRGQVRGRPGQEHRPGEADAR